MGKIDVKLVSITMVQRDGKIMVLKMLQTFLHKITVAVNLTLLLIRGTIFRLLEIAVQIFPVNSIGGRVRGFIYRPFLKSCGSNLQVDLSAKLEHMDNIDVGNDVYIGHGCWISGLRGGITFEDEVMIGPFVSIISSNHKFKNGSARFVEGEGKAIHIGKGTWIASGVTVVAGVTIGKSCLLAAGSVVTKNIPDQSIAAGVPAKIIGKVND